MIVKKKKVYITKNKLILLEVVKEKDIEKDKSEKDIKTK